LGHRQSLTGKNYLETLGQPAGDITGCKPLFETVCVDAGEQARLRRGAPVVVSKTKYEGFRACIKNTLSASTKFSSTFGL
jgi:hypothetical protein